MRGYRLDLHYDPEVGRGAAIISLAPCAASRFRRHYEATPVIANEGFHGALERTGVLHWSRLRSTRATRRGGT
jgi:hypothetical protein